MTDETDKIVAWLRAWGQRPIAPGSLRGPEALLSAADAIERGDHLVWRQEPTIKVADWIDKPSCGR